MVLRLLASVAALVVPCLPAPAAAPPPPAGAPAVLAPADPAPLPLRLPDYELRTLDERKELLFTLPNGQQAVARVPVFLYVPVDPPVRIRALALAGEARGRLVRAAAGEVVTATDLAAVRADLERLIAVLEGGGAVPAAEPPLKPPPRADPAARAPASVHSRP